MADNTTEDALTAAETYVAAEVRAVLDEVAADTAAGLKDATEIVAARFSLSEIGRRWTARMPRIVRRLLRVAEDAGQAAASDARTELPEGWDDLPGRYDRDEPLPASLGSYVTSTEHLLRAVGDRLTEAAVTELAAGLDAGEDIDALRSRLRALFSRDGSQLGDTREERIARTESNRAWNAATLAAAEGMAGEGRPLVKQWQTRRDAKVRDTHDDADGQIRLLDEEFTVGGVSMRYPGDPAAPPALTVNCRCILRLAPEQQASACDSQVPSAATFKNPRGNSLGALNPAAFHGTPGRPSYRKYHPSGGNGKRRGLRTLPGGGILGSDSFSEEEHLAALTSYNGLGYRGMNGALRHGAESGEITSPQHLEEVRLQNSALTDLIDIQEPTMAATTLYRGMRVPRRQQFKLAEGDEFHDRGFLSTSSDQSTAQSFAGDDERSVMFTIIAPAGSRMADMNGLRDLRSSEQEYILPPGSKFRVRRVVRMDLDEEDDSGPAHYELELINSVTAGGALLGPDRRPVTDLKASAEGGFQERLTWLPEQVVIDRRAKGRVSAAAVQHTGGMIALIPTGQDTEFLALPDGEDPEELHCTLWFLGDDTSDWTADQRNELIDHIRAQAAELPGPVSARTFGVNHWNPDSDSPAWVWAVGDDRDSDGPTLHDARTIAVQALEGTHDRPDTPAQHSPWVAHITGTYTADTDPFEPMCERLGPVVFDRIRVAFGGDHYDIPIGPEQEEHMGTPISAAQDTPPPPVRTWSTPGMTALAFEDEQTGDGRVFGPGALYWDGDGPWPLQYAEAMGQGHEGAELAGAIHTIGRDNPRITGAGVLYLTQAAGYDACTLLDQGAPLGVSVDLDDADVQLVDTTTGPEEVVLEASFASASAMRLADGTWMISGRTGADWTASGTEMSQSARTFMMFTRPGGTITTATARHVFGDQLTAAAGDSDPAEGTVFHEEKSGDFLVRITRARLRGATLVAMPAYDRARIVLDPPGQEQTASAPVTASAKDDYDQVVTYIRSSPVPVSPREAATKLDLALEDVRTHIMQALKDGAVLRIARGLYIGSSTIPAGHATAAAADGQEASTVSASLDALYDEHGAELIASAWNAIQAEGPMPAAWFREPTREELPPGSGGVHIVDGRAYGWVAQAGVAHAAYGRKVTIEKLAARGLDYSHFLRTKFRLDDGTEVRAGAMTMNVGHHRDGYECETNVCQFDDTRTVGAVVTVGMNEGGMWFSGAAAPWLSPWDRTVFQACQPSYHMTQGQDGRWQLKAVLSVPVPGHSSPLTAAAVIDRANLALTAAAAVLDEAASTPEPEPATALDDAQAPDVAGQITAALLQPAFLDQFADALKAREEQRAAAARTELQELTARLAPLRAEIAATAA
ncbi:phage minor head protein [Streptomyces sp. NPDC004728]|uniref:phage minor head protein n=1 Tax=Streptomyces sp. NPDC004728 TaxID=3154289 RepID=UPI0033B93836